MKRSIVRPSVRPFVRLSHRSTAAAACGSFAAERRAGRIYRSQRSAATRRSTALSSKCGQCHVDSRGRRLNTDLFSLIAIVFLHCGRLQFANVC